MDFIIGDEQSKRLMCDYINRLPETKQYDISVVVHVNKRSDAQNRLYHMWKRIIAKETCNDDDTVHKVLCKMFLGVDVSECMGQKVAKIKGTHGLKTDEMTDFLNNVEAFALNELNIILPRPEDLTILKK